MKYTDRETVNSCTYLFIRFLRRDKNIQVFQQLICDYGHTGIVSTGRLGKVRLCTKHCSRNAIRTERISIFVLSRFRHGKSVFQLELKVFTGIILRRCTLYVNLYVIGYEATFRMLFVRIYQSYSLFIPFISR